MQGCYNYNKAMLLYNVMPVPSSWGPRFLATDIAAVHVLIANISAALVQWLAIQDVSIVDL